MTDRRKGDILLENDPLPKVGNGGFVAFVISIFFYLVAAMKLLNDILNNVPEFGQLLAAMDSGRCPVALSGLSAVHRAHFAAGVYARTGRPVVLVCADEGEGERLAWDLESLTGRRVPVLAPGPTSFTTRPLSPASGSTGGWP